MLSSTYVFMIKTNWEKNYRCTGTVCMDVGPLCIYTSFDSYSSCFTFHFKTFLEQIHCGNFQVLFFLQVPNDMTTTAGARIKKTSPTVCWYDMLAIPLQLLKHGISDLVGGFPTPCFKPTFCKHQ